MSTHHILVLTTTVSIVLIVVYSPAYTAVGQKGYGWHYANSVNTYWCAYVLVRNTWYQV